MRYPIAIESGDAKHAYGVVVPDLPGCFSAGDNLDEALTKAREAILLHLDRLLDDGLSFPKPSTIVALSVTVSAMPNTIAYVAKRSAPYLPPDSACRRGMKVARFVSTKASPIIPGMASSSSAAAQSGEGM